jgi:hypothetical protein
VAFAIDYPFDFAQDRFSIDYLSVFSVLICVNPCQSVVEVEKTKPIWRSQGKSRKVKGKSEKTKPIARLSPGVLSAAEGSMANT